MARALLWLVLLLWAAAGLRDGFDAWVDRTDLPPVLAEVSVEVRDRDGVLLRAFPVEDGRQRLALTPAQVDPAFLQMLIAYEDKRFRRHRGVDALALLRAAGQAAWHGRVVSGGSTLTMQVARLLENSGTGSWPGKVRQIRVALALERRFGKDAILQMYLTHAPYGGAVEGLRAGTLAWFGKEPRRLADAEAALLIALPQAPEARRPDRHPEAARAARDRVLARLGLPQAERHAAIPTAQRPFPRLAAHLADHLRAQDPGQGRHDLTLDAALQARMERLAQLAADGQPAGVSAAIIVADHRTGEILASVGAPAYTDAGGASGFVDMTRAARSPGSTLKPFIYGLAFDRGLAHPDTLIDDAPVAFGGYAPQNFDGLFRGQVTVREALHQSLNIPPVLLLNEMGPARLMSALRRGGARPVLQGAPGLAIALGGLGLSLQDLVQLYAALPQGGAVRPLHWQRGGAGQASAPLLSAAAAWQVTQMLATVPPPPGHAARTGEIAYKTGTSYGHRDAWALGFDGRHVAGVWLGRPDGAPVPGAFGGSLAAPILFEAFGRIGPHRADLPPPPPDALILTTARLPQPLQRFRPRAAAYLADPDGPRVAFPPEGAVVRRIIDGVALKVRAGELPLTVLLNGAPVATGLMQRETLLPALQAGFARISVIDAKGRADQVSVRIE